MRRLFHLLIGLLYTGFGAYLWTRPLETLLSYSFYLSLVHIVGAIATLTVFLVYKVKPVPYGLIFVSFVIGCAMISLPLLSLSVLVSIFTVSFLAVAAFYLNRLLRHRDTGGILSILLAGAAVVYGIIMLFNPLEAANTFAKVIAVFVMMNGVSYLLSALSKDEVGVASEKVIIEAQSEEV